MFVYQLFGLVNFCEIVAYVFDVCLILVLGFVLILFILIVWFIFDLVSCWFVLLLDILVCVHM